MRATVRVASLVPFVIAAHIVLWLAVTYVPAIASYLNRVDALLDAWEALP